MNVTACPVFGLAGAQLKSGVANALPGTWTLPTIDAWIWQWNAKVPGRVKV